ncbi:NAD(P)-binding protein [Fistulina hepatica ATCC 64428]|uniref:NAD(P)-binding protein n=1 Tax=Fistulina hepatica ATCC 64428 TaxID=1128425 RepID=A0A0D7AEP8_9AGAR|nr:NAD(P)-binding protein [Fistulina hepatica ATCC 64428]
MSLLVLSDSDVARVTSSMHPPSLVTLMGRVFHILSSKSSTQTPSQISTQTPHRTSISTDHHNVLFMPARVAHRLLIGTTIKVVSVPTSSSDSRGLPASTLVLDEDTGAVRAVINARGLTALRNAAGSLLSCRVVGVQTPRSIVCFGSGKQIEVHLDLFVRAYPSITIITVVARRATPRAQALLNKMHAHFPGISCNLLDSTSAFLQCTVSAADLIICATPSTTPLFSSAWVKPGTHVMLIGSYKPEMQEVEPDLVRRAAGSGLHRLLVDSRDACRVEAGDLIQADIDWDAVAEIGEAVSFDEDGAMVEDPTPTSSSGDFISMFKSVGVGLQDVAIACAVVDKALALGLGHTIEGYDNES